MVKKYTFPLTARRVVKTVFTDLAVIRITAAGMVLEEVAPRITPQEVQDCTEPSIAISPTLKEMEL